MAILFIVHSFPCKFSKFLSSFMYLPTTTDVETLEGVETCLHAQLKQEFVVGFSVKHSFFPNNI